MDNNEQHIGTNMKRRERKKNHSTGTKSALQWVLNEYYRRMKSTVDLIQNFFNILELVVVLTK